MRAADAQPSECCNLPRRPTHHLRPDRSGRNPTTCLLADHSHQSQNGGTAPGTDRRTSCVRHDRPMESSQDAHATAAHEACGRSERLSKRGRPSPCVRHRLLSPSLESRKRSHYGLVGSARKAMGVRLCQLRSARQFPRLEGRLVETTMPPNRSEHTSTSGPRGIRKFLLAASSLSAAHLSRSPHMERSFMFALPMITTYERAGMGHG